MTMPRYLASTDPEGERLVESGYYSLLEKRAEEAFFRYANKLMTHVNVLDPSRWSVTFGSNPRTSWAYAYMRLGWQCQNSTSGIVVMTRDRHPVQYQKMPNTTDVKVVFTELPQDPHAYCAVASSDTQRTLSAMVTDGTVLHGSEMQLCIERDEEGVRQLGVLADVEHPGQPYIWLGHLMSVG